MKRVFAPLFITILSLVTVSGQTVSAPSDEKRWGISLRGGASIPHGELGEAFEPSVSLGADLEYRLNNDVSVEGIFGFHRFRLDSFFGDDHSNLYQLSGNLKYYAAPGSSVRPFFNGGGGVYVFDSATARGGVNGGGGVQVNVTPTVAVEVMYNFHNVFTSGSNVRFSTVQAGARWRF